MALRGGGHRHNAREPAALRAELCAEQRDNVRGAGGGRDAGRSLGQRHRGRNAELRVERWDAVRDQRIGRLWA